MCFNIRLHILREKYIKIELTCVKEQNAVQIQLDILFEVIYAYISILYMSLRKPINHITIEHNSVCVIE